MVIEERNEASRKYMERETRERRVIFEKARRRADEICRNRKRKYENDRINKMEEDLKDNDLRTSYRYIHDLREGYRPRTTICRNENGQIISEPDEIKNLWKRHFQMLLENQEEYGTLDVSRGEEEENEIEPPILEEVRQTIMARRNNKTPGIDKIHAELLKLGGEHLMNQMHTLIIKASNEEKIPEDWRKAQYTTRETSWLGRIIVA